MAQFNFVGRLLGPRGNSLKRVEASTGCRVFIRGKGSIKDAEKVSSFDIFLLTVLLFVQYSCKRLCFFYDALRTFLSSILYLRSTGCFAFTCVHLIFLMLVFVLYYCRRRVWEVFQVMSTSMSHCMFYLRQTYPSI